MCKKEKIKEVNQKIILSLLILLIMILVITTKVRAEDLLDEIGSLITFINKQSRDNQNSFQHMDSGFQSFINKASRRYQLDPHLIEAIIKVESNYNPDAVSDKGAMGLMQLMPSTAEEINVYKPFDPYENIMGGTYYYTLMLNRFGNHKQALHAYNCGPGCVERGEVPRESKQYATNVIRVYKDLKRKEMEKK
jgi:membrane-bound lytic murein transglycosylase MltF